MATNLNLAMEIYSKRFLAGLTPELAMLKAFSTDFSDDLVEPGEKIRVALVYPDAAEQFDEANNNFDRPKADLSDAEIAVNKSAIAGFGITIAQTANFRRNWWESKADANVLSVAEKMQRDIYGIVTAANFPTAPISAPLASFTRKTAAAIAGSASKAGLTVARSSLCLGSTWFYQLLGDLDSSVYGGNEAIRSGVIPNLFGFGAVVRLPGYEGPGFVTAPSAIGVGGRKVMPADTTPYRQFSSMIEPTTGMPINRVVYTSGAGGKTSFSVLAWYGVDVGVKEALVMLKE